jgi:hypothetical protein
VVAGLESLHGQTVSVSGVLSIEFEGDSPWHSPKSEQKPWYESSLWADFDHAALGLSRAELQRFNGRHVVVSAVADRHNTGHMGLWPGGLLIRGGAKARAAGA